MKTKAVLIGLLYLMGSCTNSTPDESKTENPETFPRVANEKAEDSFVYNSTYALWEYQFDTIINDFRLVQLRQFNADSLTAQRIVTIVNKT